MMNLISKNSCGKSQYSKPINIPCSVTRFPMLQVSVVDASQFLDTLGSYDSVAERGLAVSGNDERTLAHLLIDQVKSLMSEYF